MNQEMGEAERRFQGGQCRAESVNAAGLGESSNLGGAVGDPDTDAMGESEMWGGAWGRPPAAGTLEGATEDLEGGCSRRKPEQRL